MEYTIYPRTVSDYQALQTEKAMRDGRQAVIQNWVKRELGPEDLDVHVRASRLVEEACEAAQAVGVPRDRLERVLNHVYSRPAGNPYQEVGGVTVTLMGYAEVLGISITSAEIDEVKRILEKPPGHFKARQQEKRDANL